jgi:putative hydrolase of the HAD superfamily
MGTIAAVLFDLDDTLLDAESAWRLGVGHMLTERDATGVGTKDALAAWGRVFPHWFDRYLRGEISVSDSRIGRMREWAALVDVGLPEGEELAWFATYAEGYRRGWTLFPDAPGALTALRRLPLALVTNGDGVQQREKVSTLALDRVFDVVLVSSEVGVPKPEPGIFLAAAARLDRDVAGALAAGMQAAWLQRPGGPEAATVPPPELLGRFTTITTLDAVPGLAGLPRSVGWP